MSDVTGSTDSSIIPDVQLGKPTLPIWKELEGRFAALYIADAVAGTSLLPPGFAAECRRDATESVRINPIALGTTAFHNWMHSMRALPILVYLSMRQVDPKATESQAATIIENMKLDPQGLMALRERMMFLWGIYSEKKAQVAAETTSPSATTPSTGDSQLPSPTV